MNINYKNPVVSVCIPTYMGADFIGAAIESVLMQTFSDFELIVIDDNSTDETESIVANYNDSRIRFLRNDRNLGPEGNWNRCLSEARGRYFKLLPQDDLIVSNCLESQVSVLEADTEESIALVFCARTIIDSLGNTIMVRNYPQHQGGQISSRSAIRSSLRFGTNLIGEPGGVLFRKSLADKVGGFDASIGYIVDLDYWFRLLVHGDAYYLAEKLVSFRVSLGSWSFAIGNNQCTDFSHFIDRVAANPAYDIDKTIFITGKVMARANNLLRLLLYKFLQMRDKQL